MTTPEAPKPAAAGIPEPEIVTPHHDAPAMDTSSEPEMVRPDVEPSDTADRKA